MILGIDASNIRSGGGVTHLVELLRAADPKAHSFEQILVWGGSATLSKLEQRDWLCKVHDPLLDLALPYRVFWQRFRLKKLAEKAGCNVLFVPGGSDASGFKPMVTMCQNMLPFEWQEIRRYGFSWIVLKLLLLRFTQKQTFKKADGLIFLTHYASNAVSKFIRTHRGKTVIIPHGIHQRFRHLPAQHKESKDFTETHPCRIIYVSHIEPYKHQWCVAEAVSQLKVSGLHLHLDLVGPPGNAIERLRKALHYLDSQEEYICYLGAVPYENLHELYAIADINVFASSCENMPNILLEGMAGGLPIVCSNRGPMPEVLGDAGIYFDPENPDDIARALKEMINSHELRVKLAHAAFERASVYSWQRCANETFEFLAEVVRAGYRLFPLKVDD